MSLFISAVALAAHALQSGASPRRLTAGEPVTSVLVVSIRHDRDQIESKFKGPVGDSDTLRKALVERDYELFHKGSLWLAVDRAVFGSLPGTLEARAAEFFARRRYKPCSVRELPDGVRQAAIQRISEMWPDLSPQQVESTQSSVQPTASVSVQPPAGMGNLRVEQMSAPLEAIPKADERAGLADFPVEDRPGQIAELRMFVVQDARVSATLGMWDTLRPLMSAAEKEYAKLAFASSNPAIVAAREWMEKKLGSRKGEEIAYGSLSPEAQRFLRNATGLQGRLEGTKITVLPGAYQFVYHRSPTSEVRMPLSLLAMPPWSSSPAP